MKIDYQKSVSTKRCILEEDKICDNCCECFICALDPTKTCDNCARCLEYSDCSTIIMDDIMFLHKARTKDKSMKF